MYSPVQPYRLSGETRYLLYTSAEEDSFVLSARSRVLSFTTLRLVRHYADQIEHVTNLEQAPAIDLDAVIAWLGMRRADTDAELLSGAWNLFHEVAVSCGDVGEPLLKMHARRLEIYRKTFWALNLPAVSAPEAHHTPDWTGEELASIAKFLTAGLDLFLFSVEAYEL